MHHDLGTNPLQASQVACDVVDPARLLQLFDDRRTLLTTLSHDSLLTPAEAAISSFRERDGSGWELSIAAGRGRDFDAKTRLAVEACLAQEGIPARLDLNAGPIPVYNIRGTGPAPQSLGALLGSIESMPDGLNHVILTGSYPSKDLSFGERERQLSEQLMSALKIARAFVCGVRASEGKSVAGTLAIGPSQFDRVETLEADLPQHDFVEMFPAADKTIAHVSKLVSDPSFKKSAGIKGAVRLLVEADTPELSKLCAKHLSRALGIPATDIMLHEPGEFSAFVFGDRGFEMLKAELGSKEKRVLYLHGLEEFLHSNPEKTAARTDELVALLREGMMKFQGLVILGSTGELPEPVRKLFPQALSIGSPSAAATEQILRSEIEDRFGPAGTDLDLPLLGKALRGLSPRNIAFLVEYGCQVINSMRADGVSVAESPLTTNLLIKLAHEDDELRNALLDPLLR